MDGQHFDDLSRSFSEGTSRRKILEGLAYGIGTAVVTSFFGPSTRIAWAQAAGCNANSTVICSIDAWKTAELDMEKCIAGVILGPLSGAAILLCQAWALRAAENKGQSCGENECIKVNSSGECVSDVGRGPGTGTCCPPGMPRAFKCPQHRGIAQQPQSGESVAEAQARRRSIGAWTMEVLEEMGLVRWAGLFRFCGLSFGEVYKALPFSDRVWYRPDEERPVLLFEG